MEYKTKNLEVRWRDDFEERMDRAKEIQHKYYGSNGDYIGEYDKQCINKWEEVIG